MNMNEAILISFVTSLANRPLEYDDIKILHQKVNNCMPEPTGVSEANLCDLLKSMQDGRKIDAIRSYRAMTKATLTDSKNAVELYWSAQPKAVEKLTDTV